MDEQPNASAAKKILISYSRNDGEFVANLDRKLQAADIEAWIDQRDIQAGFPWRDEIFKAIIQCECIIVCLSPSYIDSSMCRMEIYLAQCYGKKILPIMIDRECWEDLHKYRELANMRDLSVINFVNNKIFGLSTDPDSQIEKLISAITGEADPRYENPEIYISYKSENAAYATKVADDLYEKGFNTWIATKAYKVGEQWQKSQWKALMEASIIVVILSEAVAGSEYIRKELLVAITRKIPILPVLVEHEALATPEYTRTINEQLTQVHNYGMRWISDIQWFYPNQPDYGTMIAKLESAIKRLRLTSLT